MGSGKEGEREEKQRTGGRRKGGGGKEGGKRRRKREAEEGEREGKEEVSDGSKDWKETRNSDVGNGDLPTAYVMDCGLYFTAAEFLLTARVGWLICTCPC